MIIVNMIAATLIAIMAGLGIGGGGLLVIYLTMILGTEQLNAQGINLVFFIFSAIASLIIHFKKRDIDIQQILILAITGISASLLGTKLSHNMDTALLRKVFGFLLVVSGIITLFKKKKG